MNNENNNIKPLETNNISAEPVVKEPNVESQVETVQPIMNETSQIAPQPLVSNSMEPINQEAQVQSQLQSIPTVEQNKEQFINNAQSINQNSKEEKKEGINFVFIIILFIIILVAIYFLFPILSKYI